MSTLNLRRTLFAIALTGSSVMLGWAGEQDKVAAPETLLECTEATFRPTSSGATVHWVTRGPVEARVAWGHDPQALLKTRELKCDGLTEVILDGLEAGREAYYRCSFRAVGETDYRNRPLRRFHTKRAADQTFRVSLIADSHVYGMGLSRGSAKNLEATIQRCVADEPDFVIFLGDEAGVHFYEDRPADLGQELALRRWREWRQIYTPLLESTPGFLTLGNHEGEAGYYEHLELEGHDVYLQRWGTAARRRYLANPLPDTYPEGGENEAGADGRAHASPLQNYFAWTWGSALFVVLDVQRYTTGRENDRLKGRYGAEVNVEVEDWTLGPVQLAWLERVLAGSDARHKLVFGHHLVGGWSYDLEGKTRKAPYKYGRGGARYAMVGEQARITQLMQRHAARFFFYGHDHVFAHQAAEKIEFVCCGRPTFLRSSWWNSPGWREAYGQWQDRKASSFLATTGYTRLTIGEEVTIEYVRTAHRKTRWENVEVGEGEVVYRWDTSMPSPGMPQDAKAR